MFPPSAKNSPQDWPHLNLLVSVLQDRRQSWQQVLPRSLWWLGFNHKSPMGNNWMGKRSGFLTTNILGRLLWSSSKLFQGENGIYSVLSCSVLTTDHGWSALMHQIRLVFAVVAWPIPTCSGWHKLSVQFRLDVWSRKLTNHPFLDGRCHLGHANHIHNGL